MCLNFLIRKRRKSKVKAESDRLKKDNKINKNSSGTTSAISNQETIIKQIIFINYVLEKDRGSAKGETLGIKTGNAQGLRLSNVQDEKSGNLEIPKPVSSSSAEDEDGEAEANISKPWRNAPVVFWIPKPGDAGKKPDQKPGEDKSGSPAKGNQEKDAKPSSSIGGTKGQNSKSGTAGGQESRISAKVEKPEPQNTLSKPQSPQNNKQANPVKKTGAEEGGKAGEAKQVSPSADEDAKKEQKPAEEEPPVEGNLSKIPIDPFPMDRVIIKILELVEVRNLGEYCPIFLHLETDYEYGKKTLDNLEIPEIPSINPFIVDIVIVRLIAKADVSSLKNLRKMDIKWNYFGTNMLEKRASKGQLKAVYLSGESCQEKFDEFLNSTWSNPKLFRSFRINFEYLKVNYRSISKYSPKFLQLDIKNHPLITVDDKKTLHLFLALIAPEIQELEVHVHDPPNNQWDHMLDGHYKVPVFPKLERFLCIGNECSQWYDSRASLRLFDFLLSKGGKNVDHTPNLTALEIKLNIWDWNQYFGTDQLTPVAISRWSRLTHLTIHKRDGQNIALANFLQSLGQGGMRLESLELTLKSLYIMNEWPVVCRNLSEFFQTQAKSLKILDFTCVCRYPETNSKIQFPIFEVLHTLKLKGCLKLRPNNGGPDDIPMFKMGPLKVHFPKLYHLQIHNQLLTSLFPGGVVVPIRLEFSILYDKIL